MPLCGTCERFDLANLLDDDEELQDVVLHKAISQMRDKALACDLCGLFWRSLSEKLPHQRIPENTSMLRDPDGPVVIRGNRNNDEDLNALGIHRAKVRCDRLRVSSNFSFYAEDEEHDAIPPPLKYITLTRRIKPPAQQLDLLRSWTQTCNETHANCRRGLSPLPTRVIDVGQDGRDPRLVVTTGQAGRYMTLSHCWGLHPVVRTIHETLKSHLQALPLSSLPNTFRDAVLITRALGVQYLWIDSLCIVQDSREDWERESAKMGMIYFSSYLTIAASAAKDSTGGCFVPRDNSSHAQVKATDPDYRRTAKVFIRPCPGDFSTLSQRTLHTRAWVLQEQILSARMINFDVDQLLWRCQEAHIAEDGITPEFSSLDNGPDMSPSMERYKGSNDTFEWESDWYEMVEGYSNRGITKSMDKLPALSGLAKVLEERTGVEYVAGMWKSHLALGLLWYRKGRRRRWLVPPADGYRAPSWSWASLEGEVSMVEPASNIQSNLLEVLVEDLETEVKPRGLDPNGSLDSGSLTLTGRVRTFDRRMNPQNPAYEWVREINVEGKEGITDYFFDKGEVVGQAIFDEAFKSNDQPLYCLQVVRYTISHSRWKGLLLERTGEEGEYRRIGYCVTEYVHNVMWFDGVPKVRIRIV